ncbi:diguanylate cyclase domain-containing protein [Shewanella woodyi]|uniref:diguanylate cyclase domain-containing protein n=1 Tax=Shewanella woodyi TaxID=60961 RepID=UPI0035B53A7F
MNPSTSRAHSKRHSILNTLALSRSFQKVNDKFGHLIGDELLRKTAEALKVPPR